MAACTAANKAAFVDARPEILVAACTAANLADEREAGRCVFALSDAEVGRILAAADAAKEPPDA